MAYEIACRSLGMDCDFVARGETMDDLMAVGGKHGKEVHGYTDEQLQDPAMAEKLKTVVKQV